MQTEQQPQTIGSYGQFLKVVMYPLYRDYRKKWSASQLQVIFEGDTERFEKRYMEETK